MPSSVKTTGAVLGIAVGLGAAIYFARRTSDPFSLTASYQPVSGRSQWSALVVVRNVSGTSSLKMLSGYQVKASDVSKLSSFLVTPTQLFNQLSQHGLVQGHWFSSESIVAVNGKPVNPSLAQSSRTILVPGMAPGKSQSIGAYTAVPEDPTGIVNFWFLTDPGSTVVLGSLKDPRPEMIA